MAAAIHLIGPGCKFGRQSGRSRDGQRRLSLAKEPARQPAERRECFVVVMDETPGVFCLACVPKERTCLALPGSSVVCPCALVEEVCATYGVSRDRKLIQESTGAGASIAKSWRRSFAGAAPRCGGV